MSCASWKQVPRLHCPSGKFLTGFESYSSLLEIKYFTSFFSDAGTAPLPKQLDEADHQPQVAQAEAVKKAKINKA